MKLAIVGSRKISFSQCQSYIQNAIAKYKPCVIVSGGAKGVDTHAETIAKAQNIQTEIYKPNWKLGKHAGFVRNSQIVANAQIVLCIFPGLVPEGGTKDTMQKAQKAGLLCECVFLGLE